MKSSRQSDPKGKAKAKVKHPGPARPSSRGASVVAKAQLTERTPAAGTAGTSDQVVSLLDRALVPSGTAALGPGTPVGQLGPVPAVALAAATLKTLVNSPVPPPSPGEAEEAKHVPVAFTRTPSDTKDSVGHMVAGGPAPDPSSAVRETRTHGSEDSAMDTGDTVHRLSYLAASASEPPRPQYGGYTPQASTTEDPAYRADWLHAMMRPPCLPVHVQRPIPTGLGDGGAASSASGSSAAADTAGSAGSAADMEWSGPRILPPGPQGAKVELRRGYEVVVMFKLGPVLMDGSPDMWTGLQRLFPGLKVSEAARRAAAPGAPVRIHCRHDGQDLRGRTPVPLYFRGGHLSDRPPLPHEAVKSGDSASPIAVFCSDACRHEWALPFCTVHGARIDQLYKDRIDRGLPLYSARPLPLEALAIFNCGIGLDLDTWRQINDLGMGGLIIEAMPHREWNEFHRTFEYVEPSACDPMPQPGPTPPGFVSVVATTGGQGASEIHALVASDQSVHARAVRTQLGDPAAPNTELERTDMYLTQMLSDGLATKMLLRYSALEPVAAATGIPGGPAATGIPGGAAGTVSPRTVTDHKDTASSATRSSAHVPGEHKAGLLGQGQGHGKAPGVLPGTGAAALPLFRTPSATRGPAIRASPSASPPPVRVLPTAIDRAPAGSARFSDGPASTAPSPPPLASPLASPTAVAQALSALSLQSATSPK